MDGQNLLVAGQAVDLIEKSPLALIGKMSMVPAYHDFQARDSGDRDVACIVLFLRGDDAGLQVPLGQLFALFDNRGIGDG